MTNYAFIRFILTFCCLSFLGLSGCSILPQQSEKIRPAGSLLLLNKWTLKAKIGIKTPEESGMAHLVWEQDGQDYTIHLRSPVGQQLAKLERRENQVVLTTSDGKTTKAQSEDALIFSMFGKPLPISQLRFWVKGLKAPFVPIKPISSSIEHLEFVQEQWQVRMEEFQIVDGYRLPMRLKLKYPARKADDADLDLTIRFIVKDWQIPVDSDAQASKRK